MDSDYSDCSDYSDEEEMLSDLDDEPQTAPQQPSCSCTIVSRDSIRDLQAKDIASVQNILGCDTTSARVLLLHFRWNIQTLFGALAERDTDGIYRAAGVMSRCTSAPSAPSTPGGDTADSAPACTICFSEDNPSCFTSMDCGHAYCNDCWRTHVDVQMGQGKGRRIACMAEKCGAICQDERVIMLLVERPDLREKFLRGLLESYVDDSVTAKWCPSVPHCGNAAQIDGDPHVEVDCTCGKSFCFHCLQDPHSPCTCDMLQKWQKKFTNDDSETTNWLTANTKPCPKCSKAVEKNGGCNLVQCKCGQTFCWLCGAATGRDHTWTQIYGHECGRYKEEVDKRIDSAQRSVKRFLHYESRWAAHMRSLEAEDRARSKIRSKVDAMCANQSATECAWLTKAMEQLFPARRILGYSYIFAYYMFDGQTFAEDINAKQSGIMQNLFEDQQAQLEHEVERLSGIVETPPDKFTDELRLHAINSTVNIDKRLSKLFEVVENDLLGKLQLSPNTFIAPYKGKSTVHAPSSTCGTEYEVIPPCAPAQLIDLTASTSGASSQDGKRQSEGGEQSAEGAPRHSARSKKVCINLVD